MHIPCFQKDYTINRLLFHFCNYGMGGAQTNEFSAAAASKILLQNFLYLIKMTKSQANQLQRTPLTKFEQNRTNRVLFWLPQMVISFYLKNRTETINLVFTLKQVYKTHKLA